MTKPIKAVLKIFDEIDERGQMWAAEEIRHLRKTIDDVIPTVEMFARGTVGGSYFIAEWKRRKADRKRKK